MVDTAQRNTAFLVAGCFFMEILDGTIVTTSAPQIAASLHASPPEIGLVITAYLLTLAVLIPVSGWLTRRWDGRIVFLVAIALFTVSSVGCGLSASLEQLIAMRVLQGVGGAMMVPVGRLLVFSKTDKRDLLRVMSYIVWPGLLAPVIAPLAGGLITTYASWRWLFFVNVPLGLVAFVVAARIVESTPASRPPRFDWIGVLLSGTGLGALAYSAHLLSQPFYPWLPAAGLGAASLVMLAAAARHLLRTEAPLVNLQVLRVPTLRVSLSGGSLFWISIGAAPFLFPLLFQDVFGWSPVKSGAVVLLIFVGNIAIKPATTPMLNRYGFRRVILGATGGVAITMVAASLIRVDTPVAIIGAIAVLSGVARSTGLTGFSTIGLSDIAPERLRDANALAATAQTLSLGLGIAAATVALRVGAVVADALPGRSGLTTPYSVAFLILAAITLLAMLVAAQLHPDAADHLRRRERVPTTATPAQPPTIQPSVTNQSRPKCPMDVRIGLPATLPGIEPVQPLEWARRAEARGFSSLATLARLIYPNTADGPRQDLRR